MSESIEKQQSSIEEMMTLSEIAKYLKISGKTVLRMVKRNELPGVKVSSQWRFQRTVIDNWLTAKVQSASSEDLVNVIRTKKPISPLPKLITQNHIVMDLKPGSKKDILAALVRPILDASVVSDPAGFLVSLLDRENMVSTALSEGVAIPHVRDQEASGVKKTCIVLGICKRGTDFDALDGKKTHLFFLVCAQTTASHLRLLAKISLVMRQPYIVERFCTCNTKKDVMNVLMDLHLDLSLRF